MWSYMLCKKPYHPRESVRTRMPKILVVGVDLAGVPHRPTGMCILKNGDVQTMLAYADDDILSIIDRENPDLVTVDAPLALPPGRQSIHERNEQHYRPCDLELRRRKIPFFPITLPISSFPTLSSNTVVLSPSTSVTDTFPGWSTKSFTINSTNSFISISSFSLIQMNILL